MGPGAALGEGLGLLGPRTLEQKNWIFEWRRLAASFVPFPKFILSKRDYVLRQSARIIFYSRKRMPLFVASDGSAVAQGASYENKKPQLGICQAHEMT